MGNRKVYRRSWIESVKYFQSLSKEERNRFCSYCGCEGGCNLCNDISSINELDIIEDEVFDKNDKKRQSCLND